MVTTRAVIPQAYAVEIGHKRLVLNGALAGIEPALLAESDFESDASTSSAIGARMRAVGSPIERAAAEGQRSPSALRPIAPRPRAARHEWRRCALRMDAGLVNASAGQRVDLLDHPRGLDNKRNCIDPTPPVGVQLQMRTARPWRPVQRVGIKGNRKFFPPPSGPPIREDAGVTR